MARHYTPEIEARKAQQIAKLILSIPTESRGNALLKVATELSSNSQHYTAKLIRHAGEVYNQGTEP